jgi:hypothetical protein
LETDCHVCFENFGALSKLWAAILAAFHHHVGAFVPVPCVNIANDSYNQEKTSAFWYAQETT